MDDAEISLKELNCQLLQSSTDKIYGFLYEIIETEKYICQCCLVEMNQSK